MSPTDYEAFLARRNAAPAEAAAISVEASSIDRTPSGVAMETPAAAADTRERRLGSGLATKLETVTEKAIDKIDGILDLTLDRADPHFASVLRAQTAAANTTLTTQVKVDETALRRQQLDRLPALLKLADEIAAQLPPLKNPVIDGGENEP